MCQDGMQNVSLQVRFPRNYSELVHWHSIGYTFGKRGAPVIQTTSCNGVSVSHNSHSASTRSLWHRLLCVYIATCRIMWFTQAHPMIEQPMDTIVWNLKHSTVNGTKLAWVANQQSSQDVRPSNSRNILATDCYSIVSCKSRGKFCYWCCYCFSLPHTVWHPSALYYLAEKAVASVSVGFHGCKCGNDLSIKQAR